MAGVSEGIFLDIDNNLKSFTLLWLDAQVNTTEDNKKTQKRLRSINNHIRTFDNIPQCQQIIETITEDENRFILIVSGQLGRQIVPNIHNLQQISSIFVYCGNKQLNDEWARQYSKIKDVIVKQDDLIIQIKLYQESRIKLEEQIAFQIYTIPKHPDASITKYDNLFIDSLVLINALLRLKHDSNNHQQLISICNKEYEGNRKQLNLIREFKDHYQSNQALLWYTRESFFYRILGKALRTPNMELLILFHFVIHDIYEQLKLTQCKSSIRVYRGQIMFSRELKYIQQSINNYMLINSFLLTNTNRVKISNFLQNSNIKEGQHRVLFIIDADPSQSKTKIFADISQYNNHHDGNEILFMFGCIFQVINIEENGNLTIIHMKLCSDYEDDLKDLFRTMKELYDYQHEDNKINLQTFADIARRKEKYTLAQTIYNWILNELPSNDPTLSDIYCSLGTISKERQDFEASLRWYKKSLENKKRVDPTNNVGIGHLHGCVGEAYVRKNEDNKALEHYKKAIELFQQSNNNDHPHMADFYSNIGSIYKRKNNDSEALIYFKKALTIDENHSLSDRHNVAKSHNNIGIIYCRRGEYDLAMEHYQISLEIKLNSRPPRQISIGKTYKNIGYVHEIKGDLQKALMCYETTATIYQPLLPPQCEEVEQVNRDIDRVLIKLK